MKAVKHSIVALVGIALVAGPFGLATADDADELERRVKRLENVLEGDRLIELMDRLDDVEQELREVRGGLEEQGHRLEELQERQRNLYSDLDERLREVELAADRDASGGSDEGGDGGDSAGPETVEQASAEPAAEAEGSEREAYEAAFDTLREGRYEEAAEAFSAFLDDYGDSDYAANARYWLGESHYVTREFDTALEHFEAVVDDHPDSSKVPDARLKIGYTQYELDETDAARETLQDVADEYDDESVGRLAEERLLRIREEAEGEEDD